MIQYSAQLSFVSKYYDVLVRRLEQKQCIVHVTPLETRCFVISSLLDMNKVKIALAIQVILIGTTAYWNGWIRYSEKAVMVAAKDNIRNATSSHNSNSRPIIFHSHRTDSMAQTHQCIQQLPPPRRVGTLELQIFEDDILRGKSCSSATNEWVCRDCGLSCDYDDWSKCPQVKRRKVRQCNQNIMRNWSEPSINQVTFDPLASFQPSRRKIHQYFERPSDPGRDLEQIDCQGVTDERCFNLSKCEETILTVYSYPNTEAAQYLNRVEKRNPSTIKVVDRPENACLAVLSGNYMGPGVNARSYLNLLGHTPWKEGRNHFIWEANRCFVDHQDYLMTKNINFQRAALSGPNFNDLNLRQQFDIPIPYFQRSQQQDFSVNATLMTSLDLHRPRRFLIMFKALFQTYNLFWQQHRWLAFQYWDRRDPDILMDVKCGKKDKFSLPTGSAEYAGYMLDSAFVFCPGGLSPSSYRFHEALALQAIPVVTADFVAPFEPDIDWSDCLVRVSESRIADIPRLLRETYSQEDIKKRREQCQILFMQTIGWVKNDDFWQINHGRQAFEMAMKVWAVRVKSAFAAQRISNDVMQSTIEIVDFEPEMQSMLTNVSQLVHEGLEGDELNAETENSEAETEVAEETLSSFPANESTEGILRNEVGNVSIVALSNAINTSGTTQSKDVSSNQTDSAARW